MHTRVKRTLVSAFTALTSVTLLATHAPLALASTSRTSAPQSEGQSSFQVFLPGVLNRPAGQAPAPTPSITPNPALSPTPSPTPGMSATPTPEPSATATQTPTPTPTETATPTATPTATTPPVIISYQVITPTALQPPILVVNASAPVTITIPQIAAGAPGTPGLSSTVLEQDPVVSTEWKLNHRLRIGAGVTLRVDPSTVTWLKLRSNASAATTLDRPTYVFLETVSGTLSFENTKVTSWDFVSNTEDSVIANGRAYVRASGPARMDIINSEFAYLGASEGGGGYGISWRDDDTSAARVTGNVIDSRLHHNYYGFYSYAASGMTIRGNKFYENVVYGFDPHDYSRDMLVENNEAYDNGNHGFIISRGCYNFVFRGNKSYRNKNLSSSNRAHGFMLDPGGSGGPQVASYNITLENNEAFDNEGYGIRMLDVQTSTIRNNRFANNYHGITIERNSFNNLIEGNTIFSNTLSGIQLTGATSGPAISARNNRIISNTIERNGAEQILISDTAADNAINSNTLIVVTTTAGSPAGIKVINNALNNTWSQNVIMGASSISRSVQVTPTAHMGLGAPTNLVLAGATLSGKAEPGARIEIFSSNSNKNAEHFEGFVIADASGDWSFTVPTGLWQGLYKTALQTVAGKGSSAFAPTIRP